MDKKKAMVRWALAGSGLAHFILWTEGAGQLLFACLALACFTVAMCLGWRVSAELEERLREGEPPGARPAVDRDRVSKAVEAKLAKLGMPGHVQWLRGYGGDDLWLVRRAGEEQVRLLRSGGEALGGLPLADWEAMGPGEREEWLRNLVALASA